MSDRPDPALVLEDGFWVGMTDETLAEMWEQWAEESRRLARMSGMALQELKRRMMEREASILELEGWSGVLKPGPYTHEVDGAAMMALKEHVPEAVWEKTYVTPEPRWDHRQLNQLRRLGGEILRIIDGARRSTRGDPVLELKRRETS